MARKRESISVTIPKEVTSWVDEQVKVRRFSSRSHAVEVALLELMNEQVAGASWLRASGQVRRQENQFSTTR